MNELIAIVESPLWPKDAIGNGTALGRLLHPVTGEKLGGVILQCDSTEHSYLPGARVRVEPNGVQWIVRELISSPQNN